MPSLKTFRNRIAGVTSTQKLTRAMQLVAATKAKRAREAAEMARPYAERIASIVANLAVSVIGQSSAPALLRGTGSDKVHLFVVMTSERGLCGGFNSNIVKLARLKATQALAEGKTVKFLTVGRKGRDQLRRYFPALLGEHVDLSAVRRLSSQEASLILTKILPGFEAGAFDVCTLIYSRFKSVLTQVPTAQILIPAQPEATVDRAGDKSGDPAHTAPTAPGAPVAAYEYEPDEESLLAGLLPLYVNSQVFRALLENGAGEQAARMAAMDAATRNAGELIKKLKLQYNRQRQANITKELIEIISGAEAL